MKSVMSVVAAATVADAVHVKSTKYYDRAKHCDTKGTSNKWPEVQYTLNGHSMCVPVAPKPASCGGYRTGGCDMVPPAYGAYTAEPICLASADGKGTLTGACALFCTADNQCPDGATCHAQPLLSTGFASDDKDMTDLIRVVQASEQYKPDTWLSGLVQLQSDTSGICLF